MVTLVGALTLTAFVVVGLATYRSKGLVYLVQAELIGGAVLGITAFTLTVSIASRT